MRLLPFILIAVAAIGGQASAAARCARDGAIIVRAPQGLRAAAVYVDGRRRGKVRRGRPRHIAVPAGRTVTIRLVGRRRSGRRVTRRIRARVCAAPTPAGFIVPEDARLRYEGRWDLDPGRATTVNSGARVFMRFTGTEVTASFDVAGITQPPQVYAWVDGERSAFREVGRRLRLTPDGLEAGTHTLVLGVKDVSQDANRWRPPFASALQLTGFDLAGGTLEEPPAAGTVRFTFLGDSITQGVASRCVVDPDQVESSPGAPSASDCSDATLDYAWRVAGMFGAQLEQVGFGGQGVTTGGAGNVPPAPDSLGWNFRDSPAAPFDAHVVVINQGTNDFIDNAPRAEIQAAYLALLRGARARYPGARILALGIFGAAGGTETGDVNAAIRRAVFQMGDFRTAYVSTRDWLTPVADFSDSIHPNDGGHRKISARLAQTITSLTGLRPVAPLDAPPG